MDNLRAVGASVGLLSDVIRYLSFLLDMISYSLIPVVFDLIYKLYDLPGQIASVEALNTLANSIYSLLAIFMFFKVAFSLLGMLVDPSMIADNEKGAGKLVSNIFITLVLIVAVPLVFDYAFKAQSIIMEKRLIESAVFGEDFSKDDQETLGRRIAVSTWGLFLSKTTDNGAGAEAYTEIFEKHNTEYPYVNLFGSLNSTTNDQTFLERFLKFAAGSVLTASGVGTSVGIKWQSEATAFFSKSNRYQVAYVAIISAIAGFYLLWSFIKMCIDVAYRAIKLYALRMLAPVAIVSYVDPKSGKNGVFSKWLAECVKTYASLFVRIFVFAIASVILNQIDNLMQSGENFIERLFFTLAVVAFLKTAPKFIDGILGTELSKDSESKFGADLLKQGLGGLGMAAVGGAVGLASAKKLGYNGGRGFWEGAKSGFTGGVEAVNKKDPIGVISGLAKAGNGANAMRKYYGLPTAAEARKQKAEADLAKNAAEKYSAKKSEISKKVYDKMSDDEFNEFLKKPSTILDSKEKALKKRWDEAKDDVERDKVKKEFTNKRFKEGYSEKNESGQVVKVAGYTRDQNGAAIRSDSDAIDSTLDKISSSSRAAKYRASMGSTEAIQATFDKSSEIGKHWLEEEKWSREKTVREDEAEVWTRVAGVAQSSKITNKKDKIYVNGDGSSYSDEAEDIVQTLLENKKLEINEIVDPSGNRISWYEKISDKHGSEAAAKDEAVRNSIVVGSNPDTGAPSYKVDGVDYSSIDDAKNAVLSKGRTVEETDRNGNTSYEFRRIYKNADEAVGDFGYNQYSEAELREKASISSNKAGYAASKLDEEKTAREDRMKNPQNADDARDARKAQLIEAGKKRGY